MTNASEFAALSDMHQPAAGEDGAQGPRGGERVRACLECGGPRVVGRRAGGKERHDDEFCCKPCRDAFGNRRKARGAELYDLFMVHRWDRKLAVALRILQAMNRLASNWRAEDKARRAGRRSWRKPHDVLETRTYLRAIVNYDRTGRGRGAREA